MPPPEVRSSQSPLGGSIRVAVMPPPEVLAATLPLIPLTVMLPPEVLTPMSHYLTIEGTLDQEHGHIPFMGTDFIMIHFSLGCQDDLSPMMDPIEQPQVPINVMRY